MVNGPEKQPGRLSRTEVVGALLGFIEKTTAASDEYKRAGEQAELLGRGQPFAQSFREASFAQAISAGANTINDCLAQLGGVPAAWTDRTSGESMWGTIMGCQKFDPDTGVWNLVFKGPTYSGLIGATPQRLGEILVRNPLDLERGPAD